MKSDRNKFCIVFIWVKAPINQLTKANSIYMHVYTILGFILITQTKGLTIKALKLQIKIPTSPNVPL